MRAIRHDDVVAHEGDGERGCRTCGGEPHHDAAFGFRPAKKPLRESGGKPFATSTGEQHHSGDEKDLPTGEHRLHIDEHAHTDEEIGDEKCIADKLDVVHQRAGRGDFTIEHQAYEKRA